VARVCGLRFGGWLLSEVAPAAELGWHRILAVAAWFSYRREAHPRRIEMIVAHRRTGAQAHRRTGAQAHRRTGNPENVIALAQRGAAQ
jgi:hypothetical protein